MLFFAKYGKIFAIWLYQKKKVHQTHFINNRKILEGPSLRALTIGGPYILKMSIFWKQARPKDATTLKKHFFENKYVSKICSFKNPVHNYYELFLLVVYPKMWIRVLFILGKLSFSIHLSGKTVYQPINKNDAQKSRFTKPFKQDLNH